MKKKIAIIGAGWFGCHLASEILKNKKFELKVYEKEKDIFRGASSNNQNRLHLGFHYPRSKLTRVQSKKGYKKFIKKYRFLCSKVKNNIYSIANDKDTHLDFETFCQIMKSEGLKFKKINAEKKFNICNVAGSLKTNEMLINDVKSKNYFKNKLKRYLVLNSTVRKISKDKGKYRINNEYFDYVINCTYYQSFVNQSSRIFYEVTSSLIYKNKKYFPALTIMDGPYFTIYPYKKNYYNIYSVKHSRFKKSNNINNCIKLLKKVKNNNSQLIRKKKLIEKEILKFCPDFKKNFKFAKYLNCIRTINNTNYADRSFKVYYNKRMINIFSGKIDHIISAGEEILNYLKKKY